MPSRAWRFRQGGVADASCWLAGSSPNRRPACTVGHNCAVEDLGPEAYRTRRFSLEMNATPNMALQRTRGPRCRSGALASLARSPLSFWSLGP